MDKDKGGGGFMEAIEALISGLFEVVSTIFGAIMEFAPKAISFILWALLAIVILPCVFIAGNIYPAWVEWGEKL